MISLYFFQKVIILSSFILLSFSSLAQNLVENTAIIATEVNMPFADTRVALENAIINQGLKIEKIMQIHALLERTAADYAANDSPYVNAQSFDFCSTALLHKMAALHPHNPSICPLVIFFYSLKTDPEKSFIVYRLPSFINDNGRLHNAYQALLQSIVEEASAW